MLEASMLKTLRVQARRDFKFSRLPAERIMSFMCLSSDEEEARPRSLRPPAITSCERDLCVVVGFLIASTMVIRFTVAS